MEEAAPVAVSKASMQLPSEVYKPSDAGTPKAEGEMSRCVYMCICVCARMCAYVGAYVHAYLLGSSLHMFTACGVKPSASRAPSVWPRNKCIHGVFVVRVARAMPQQ